MLHRLASLVLIFVTIGFFVLYEYQQDPTNIKFVDIIEPRTERGHYIAHNEYLILMEQGTENQVPQVLEEFGLMLAAPLGEWLHVVRGNATVRQEIVAFLSPKARLDHELIAKLEAHPAIHSAHVNFIQLYDEGTFSCVPSIKPRHGGFDDGLIVPSDPLFQNEWYLSKNSGVDMPGAWTITTGSANNVIAIVDRNFEFTEKDLSPSRCKTRVYHHERVSDYFWPEKFLDYEDSFDHGTQVLSVLAPCTDNGIGLSGIDWHAQVFAVDTGADRSLSARMFGILWAAGVDVCNKSIISCPKGQSFRRNDYPASIINASFGFAKGYLEEPAYGPVLDVIGLINRQGGMIIASAGNEGQLADRRLPGAAGGVLSVGSSNEEGNSSYFSNWGRTVDVLAPGEQIIGLKNNKPISLNGTSFSSPIVAGIASLMLSVAPELSWKHVEYIIKKTATAMSCSQYCPDTMPKTQRDDCKKLCCKNEEVICAKGIANAKEAVMMASEGIPAVPLIDVDDYFLPLSYHNNMRMTVIAKNWGAVPALVHMRKTHDDLKIFPEQFEIPPIDSLGRPGTKEVLVYFDAVPTSELVLSIILEAAFMEEPNRSVDRIEAIAEIVPDSVLELKQYRELLFD